MGKQSPETDDRRAGLNWSLRDVTDFVEACYDRDTILDVLMGYAAHWFPSRMVLIVGRSWVQLFASEGFSVPPEIDKSLRRADVDPESDAVALLEATGTPEEIGLGGLFAQLGLEPVLLKSIGIEIGGRVAIVIVGTVRTEDVDLTSLAIAASTAGQQLEDVIRLAKQDALPPAEERIPPFPEIAAEPELTKKAPSLTETTRKTQQLEDPYSQPTKTVTAPAFRIAGSAESEGRESEVEEELEEEVANATSFGLPFATRVHAPSAEELAELSQEESERADEESQERKEEDDAPSMPPGKPADESQETYVGSPVDEDEFPGALPDADEEEPADDADEPLAKTQIGGLLAHASVAFGKDSEASDEEPGPSQLAEESQAPPQTMIGTPGTSAATEKHEEQLAPDEARRTHLGGLAGESQALQASLERSDLAETAKRPAVERSAEKERSELAETAKAPAIERPKPSSPGPDETTKAPEESSGAWINRGPGKSAVPAAMVLKPARRKRRQSDGNTSTPVPGARPPQSASDEAPFRPVESGRAPESPPSKSVPTGGIEPDPSRRPTPAKGMDLERFRRPTPSVGSPTAASKPGSKEDKRSFDREESTRAYDPAGPADDAWFDYFADDAAPAAKRDSGVEQAKNYSIPDGEDEPHSLPPETLERLLDSGPQMVDMQEAFLILDSRDPDRAFEAAEKVAALGESALEVLDLMFPGRVFLDRYQFGDDMPPVNEHGPVLHALVRIGDPAVDIARRHINDSSNETRFYAVFLFTKIDAEAALGDIFARLFDRDQQIRTLSADILFDYQNAADFDREVRKPLRAELLSGEDLHVDVAARLVGRLRDPEAIMALIDTLEETDSTKVKQSVLGALRQITLHSHSSPYEWRHWWEKSRDQTRKDWIVEALDAAADDIRRLAHEEIKRIPGLELNYHPDQPSKLRQRAQKELRSWFALHS